MIQVEELADELVDGVARLHLHVHGQEEGEEKLEKGKVKLKLNFNSQVKLFGSDSVDLMMLVNKTSLQITYLCRVRLLLCTIMTVFDLD